MKPVVSILFASFVLFLTGCPSTPPAAPAKPVEQTKTQETAKPEATPQKPVEAQTVSNALTDADYAPAQKAIDEAVAAQAERYSPTLLSKAKDELAQAKTLGTSDPTQARGLLTNAVADADSARDDALAARKAAYIARLDRARQLLVDQQGDKYYPADFQSADAQRANAETELNRDVDKGGPIADEALKSLVSLYEKLTQNLDQAQRQRQAAKTALTGAEKAEAFVWVPDLLQKASDSYLQGQSALRQYQLDPAIEDWTQSEFQANQAATEALAENQRKNAEDLMLSTMKKIEKASQATVVTPNDRIVAPSPWDGQKALDSVQPAAPPQSDSATPAQPKADAPQSMLLPHGSTAVLAEKSRLSYLQDAKSTWEKGVALLKAKDYVLASQYFLEAQRLVDIYMTMAVDKVYTVRLIPDHRDSLWRISGYDNIYSSPFDWPKIWKRNQKLIQNPDLIYPGWQLIVPPQ